MPLFDGVRNALKQYDSLDGAKQFFSQLGYATMEPLPLGLEEMPAGPRGVVESAHQLVKIGDQAPFRVFHVTLKRDQVGRWGQVLRQPLRRFLESFIRHYPQGESLFVFTPCDSYDQLTFVSPKRLQDPRNCSKVRLWLRILQVDRCRPYRTDLETLSEIRAEGISEPAEIFRRHEEAFSVQRVTEQFFQDYRGVFDRIQEHLQPTHSEEPQNWPRNYTHQLLNRIMFLYFIARKGWLLGPDGTPDRDFMRHFWEAYRKSGTKDVFHSEWLQVLFFESFNRQWQNRSEYLKRFPDWLVHSLSNAPYLNGGLYTRRADLDDRIRSFIPDNYFELLFEKWTDGTFPGLFERYNFTVVETSRFDEEVAVDPEMLGTVYERLVNIAFEGDEKDQRAAAGIFYTPRVEIDLMCRLVLVDWLCNQLRSDWKGPLYEWVFAFSEEEKQDADRRVTEAGMWEKLDERVRKVRICDPACGSGSFLVGMMLVLDDLRARCNVALGRDETPYERRKRILQDQLYGVDVMEWAVRVAELRLWLQLVVETELNPAELHFRPLLPNLDLKLRPGDSLLQTLGDLDLSPFRRSELQLPSSLKGRLAKFKGKKRRFFQGTQGGLTAACLKQEEVQLFREILSIKVRELEHRIAELKESPIDQIEMLGTESRSQSNKNKTPRLLLEIKELEQQKARLEAAYQALCPEKPPPFVWDLAFVEIFADESPGFDIVIGNPPYVRQEKIRDYLEGFDRREYLQRLNEGLRAIYPGFMGKTPGISGRADYYVYFYLHGLSLLADRGTFCFITSNSWLDVDFGKDLQEFFLRCGHLKMVIDNRAKRSFSQADVNTVIVLAGTPERKRQLNKREMQGRLVRFVTFKVPFEEALSPSVFSDIEDQELYDPLAHFKVLKRQEFRAVLMDQWSLYEGGSEGQGQPLLRGSKYTGDKWGGKYLRAPDIFFTILEKGKGKLVRLGDIAEVRGYIHDNNTGPLFPEVFLLRSIKGATRIRLTANSSGVVRYGVTMRGASRRTAPVLFARTFGDRLFVLWNIDEEVLGKEFYKVIPKPSSSDRDIVALLNSSLALLQFEVFGSVALGGGGLKFSEECIKKLLLPRWSSSGIDESLEALASRPIRSIFEELGFSLCRKRRCPHPEHPYENVTPETLTLDQVRMASPDRFALDEVVFDALELTKEERLQVYQAVAQLVKDRLVKARSV